MRSQELIPDPSSFALGCASRPTCRNNHRPAGALPGTWALPRRMRVRRHPIVPIGGLTSVSAQVSGPQRRLRGGWRWFRVGVLLIYKAALARGESRTRRSSSLQQVFEGRCRAVAPCQAAQSLVFEKNQKKFAISPHLCVQCIVIRRPQMPAAFHTSPIHPLHISFRP